MLSNYFAERSPVLPLSQPDVHHFPFQMPSPPCPAISVRSSTQVSQMINANVDIETELRAPSNERSVSNTRDMAKLPKAVCTVGLAAADKHPPTQVPE